MSADTLTPKPTDQEAQEAVQLAAVKPAISSRVSTLLNRVLIVVVLFAIPLLYYFGYIGVVWLNRIGIILNFCAGFMVAPELIGQQKLEQLQIFTELQLLRFNQALSSILSQFKRTLNIDQENRTDHRIWTIYIVSALFVILIITSRLIGVNILPMFVQYFEMFLALTTEWTPFAIIVIIILFTLYLLMRILAKKERHIAAGIIAMLFVIPFYVLFFMFIAVLFAVAPFILPVIFVIIFAAVIIGTLSKLTSNAAHRLTIDGYLRSALVWWGIIFFIVGNLLQFISTF